MQYLISVDIETEESIDQTMRNTLKLAVSSIITDNLECKVVDVRLGPYGRRVLGNTAKLQSAEYEDGVKQNSRPAQ
jgi:hypothetical protein